MPERSSQKNKTKSKSTSKSAGVKKAASARQSPRAQKGKQPDAAAPDLAVDLSIPCLDWKKLGFAPGPLARSATRKTLACAQVPAIARGKKLEISIVLADDAFVHSLNRTWRGKDKPTNVLSFPQLEGMEEDDFPDLPDEERVSLGDLVLALETLERESAEQDKALRAHFAHLLVHGTLHLLGYDHERGEADAQEMEDMEIKILGQLGYKNPYE